MTFSINASQQPPQRRPFSHSKPPRQRRSPQGSLPAAWLRHSAGGQTLTLTLAMSLVTSLAPIVGCGGSSDPAAQRETAPPSPEKASVEPAATEVVSQFLDRVRRGGNDSTADQLLTKLARQEMKRIGRPLQFPGSPETTYEVRKAMPIPNEPDSVWVQTYLSEPSDEGASLQYEVVWTLRQENEQWRISGFVLDQGDQLEPLRIDFENGDEMEARLAAVEQAAEAEAEPAPLER